MACSEEVEVQVRGKDPKAVVLASRCHLSQRRMSPHDVSSNEPESPAGDDPNQRAPTPVTEEEPDIKRVFHPHNFVRRPEPGEPTDSRPWRPFRSQLDFETLISLIQRCNANPEDFTLTSQRELDELWELASHKCTKFARGTITVKYKDEDNTFDTYTRPLWDWARSLIQDPRLASSFVWDAEKAYKFDGETYVRFYQEPWTADAFWAAQSSLPDDPAAKPVCYVIYADKSKLSSFGTQKAYATRNSTRFGGGQVVGHQPIVDEDSKEKGKPAFTNFKNIVWHTAFYKLLESLVIPAKVGDWMACGDGIPRWLWPIILILAADYEEACVMALIRGLTSMYPCPICYVPWQEQSDLSMEHPQRVGQDSERLIQEARAMRTAAEREEFLKDHGLRDVDNALWKIKGSDPHEAISYNPLHADDGGFWGTHLFGQIKQRVTELGREAIVKIEEQFAAFPRWRGLHHFDSIMNTTLNDGSKHEDVAKTMLFVAHSVLVDEPGLLLLQALRSYLVLRTAIKFEVHTSDTLAVGRNELLTLDSTVKGTEPYGNKDWNFPKFHSRLHAFDHIEKKGASRNFGTKTSESMHGAIRKTYLRLTNFKDLVKHDHRRTVATYIQEQIEALNEDPSESPEDMESSVLSNIDIGSKLKPVSFAKLEQDMSHDTAFQRFRVKFGVFITQFLTAHEYNLPNGKPLRFDDTDTISPFQFLKVHYESMSDWKWTADYLRCNPKFHDHPRYDFVLVQTTDKPIFAQLLYMFSCTVEGKSHHFALILPLDAPTGNVKKKDKLLRFRRVRAQARKNSEFISLHSIIRGAVLVADSDRASDFLVFDVLDGDTSLRLKSL
ncbi:hypothetical protein B0H13DRAFT_2235919 [Mycena leptocephala]|nr:hypothetical protein B0H13DRAFT_2235919 [Mycena leptocephala]